MPSRSESSRRLASSRCRIIRHINLETMFKTSNMTKKVIKLQKNISHIQVFSYSSDPTASVGKHEGLDCRYMENRYSSV